MGLLATTRWELAGTNEVAEGLTLQDCTFRYIEARHKVEPTESLEIELEFKEGHKPHRRRFSVPFTEGQDVSATNIIMAIESLYPKSTKQ